MSKEETSVRFGLTFKRSTIGGAAALALAATPAYSLTLGEAEVMSGLNQKFQAEIDLGAISPDELGGLSVSVAPYADYQRANMEAGGVERDFRFEIVGQGNDAAIQITSDNLISEPLVVFLLEARWQRGRLLREYAIFLDPIDPDEQQQYAPRVTEPEVAPLPEPEIIAELPPKPSAAEIERTRLRAPVSNPTHPDALPELPYHYGPVKKGVSGIQVATELAQGTILTPEQMLMALFEVNPVAFHGNVNGLDAGFMLRIPDAVDISSINSEVASEEISRHNSAWRRHVSKGGDNKVVVPPLSVAEAQQDDTELSSASQEPADDDLDEEFADEEKGSAAVDADTSSASADADDALDEDDVSEAGSDEDASAEDRLELVAPENGNDEDTTLAETSTSSNPEVVAAEAESAALRVENAKLREQLTETESLLLDIRALLIARSDELSDLKARIARLEGGSQNAGDYSDELEVVSAYSPQSGNDSAETGRASDDGVEPTSSERESTSAAPKPKPSTPETPNEANATSASDDIVSKISKTYDSVVLTVISIGWLILLPLILLLLIIVLFLVRRRKKDDEPEFEVTASSVDEIETEPKTETESDFAEDSDDDDDSSHAVYAAPGMEVSAGSMEDYGDDFVDELAEEELLEEQQEDNEFDDFTDELGDDLDDSVILDEESDEDIAELDEFDIDDEVADDIDVLAPAVDDEELEVSIADPEGDDHDDLLSFDESDYQAPKEPEAPVEMDATEDDLDFDLGDFEISEPEPAAEVALDMPAVDIDVDEDFGLDDSVVDSEVLEGSFAIELDDEAEAPETDDASSLDDLVIDSGTRDELVEVDSSDVDFDLDPDLDDQLENLSSEDATALGADSPSVEATPASGDADEDIAAFAGGDQASTKLDLAKAYMEMGDDDEARSLLQEVIAEADGPTKAEAEAALAEIG